MSESNKEPPRRVAEGGGEGSPPFFGMILKNLCMMYNEVVHLYVAHTLPPPPTQHRSKHHFMYHFPWSPWRRNIIACLHELGLNFAVAALVLWAYYTLRKNYTTLHKIWHFNSGTRALVAKTDHAKLFWTIMSAWLIMSAGFGPLCPQTYHVRHIVSANPCSPGQFSTGKYFDWGQTLFCSYVLIINAMYF